MFIKTTIVALNSYCLFWDYFEELLCILGRKLRKTYVRFLLKINSVILATCSVIRDTVK